MKYKKGENVLVLPSAILCGYPKRFLGVNKINFIRTIIEKNNEIVIYHFENTYECYESDIRYLTKLDKALI